MLPTTVLVLQAQEAIKYNGIFMSNTWGQVPPYMVTNGPEKMAVLKGGRINEGFFTTKCMAVLPGGQIKAAIISR